MDAFNAKPDKGRSAGGRDVHLCYEVEGGKNISNVIEAPDLGLQLVLVIQWLITTCKQGQGSGVY